MPPYQEHQLTVNTLVKSFKNALRKYDGYYDNRKYSKYNESKSFYEEAKKAETQQRNLIKALQLYLKSMQHGEKKDSTIKDFASSLHQLGFTKQAVRFMDDCQPYYDGNKNKYFRLRDNLEIQIRPTGKHLCRFLLIENLCQDLKNQDEEKIKSLLFKSTKRIKGIKFLQDFQLDNEKSICPKQRANNLLLEFESFSAAKKTLQNFYFDEWFGSNLYWVNMTNMRIICSASDGKSDFEQGFIVTQELLNEQIESEKERFWTIFGENKYKSKMSNGFMNLLATHLIRQNLVRNNEKERNKENIFESSKIRQEKINNQREYERYEPYPMQPKKYGLNNFYEQVYENNYSQNIWRNNSNGNYYYYY